MKNWEKGEQGKEMHAAQLLREPVPACGAVKLDKPVEATSKMSAPHLARVDTAAEKCKGPAGVSDVDNETDEQSHRMKLGDGISVIARLHVCAVGAIYS